MNDEILTQVAAMAFPPIVVKSLTELEENAMDLIRGSGGYLRINKGNESPVKTYVLDSLVEKSKLFKFNFGKDSVFYIDTTTCHFKTIMFRLVVFKIGDDKERFRASYTKQFLSKVFFGENLANANVLQFPLILYTDNMCGVASYPTCLHKEIAELLTKGGATMIEVTTDPHTLHCNHCGINFESRIMATLIKCPKCHRPVYNLTY